jgi:peptidoglycan-associated lipoprotein
MFNHEKFHLALSAGALALLVGGCSSTKQVHPSAASMQAPDAARSEAPLPDTPTASNIKISRAILRACNIPDADAFFAFDSSRLTARDMAPLQAVARCFESGPLTGHHMKLVGHADPRGPTEYNMTLGQSRADSVAAYLSARGLRRDAMTTTSRGDLDATGQDETGWAHDRRVDVLLAD